MTQVLIDRALAEATLRELNLAAVTYAALGKVILKDGAEAMRDKLSAALANAEPTGWIAVKDRMPPPQVRVLGFAPRYNIVVVDMWLGPDFNWGYSYWMPLPTPPKDTP